MDGHFVPVVFYISLHYLIVIAGGGWSGNTLFPPSVSS